MVDLFLLDWFGIVNILYGRQLNDVISRRNRIEYIHSYFAHSINLNVDNADKHSAPFS